MKTKFILTAMCLPLAFAACTNEEVFVDNQNALEEKPVVDLKVAANYGAEGVDSRMVNNNGTFLWEGTDVLGAVLNVGTPVKLYSNNKFVNTLTEASATADFTTQATTVVGDYVFYYPYNTAITKDLSKGIVYSLPEPQAYDPNGDMMMDNNFMVSPNIKVDGNEPGELSLPLTMRSIYGYGLLNIELPDVFVINNTNVSSVYIQKVIVEYASNVHKNGAINLANLPVANLTAENFTNLRKQTAYAGKTDAELRTIVLNAADKELTAQKTNYAEGTILNLTSGKELINQVSIACVSEENPNGIKLNKNEKFSTRMLLPTTANEGAEIKVTVYTNKGYFVVLDTKETLANDKVRIKANHTANLANLSRDVNGSDTFVLNGAEVETVTEINAISEEDFIASVSSLKANAQVDVKVGDFSLTSAAIAAIPSTATLKFKSHVVFEGDMTLKNMELNTVDFKSGDITLVNGIVAVSQMKQMQVGGATINVNYIPSFAIRGANVTITKELSGTPSVHVKSGSLTINATNAAGTAAATTTLNEVTVGDEEDKTIGTITVNKPLAASSLLVNKDSNLNNASTINTTGSFTINAGGIVNNTKELKNFKNYGTVNNSATILSGENEGVINQMTESAKLTMTTNKGTINTVAYSETTVTANEGDIYYVENARVKANGDVTYKAPANIAATDFSSLPTAITKIEFAGDFTYNYGEEEEDLATLKQTVTTLVFKGNLKLSQNWTLPDNSTIEFVAAKANVTGGKKLSNVVTIKAGVDKDGTANDVATNLYISTNTTIETVSAVALVGGATVWNDGTVNHISGMAKPENWGGEW